MRRERSCWEGKDVPTSSPVESGGNGPRQYAVELHFTEEGAEKFADATGKLTGQRMGIFMDDTIISNPVVKDRITGGNAIIDGMESYEQAKELSDKINAGALPYSHGNAEFQHNQPFPGSLGSGYHGGGRDWGICSDLCLYGGEIPVAGLCGLPWSGVPDLPAAFGDIGSPVYTDAAWVSRHYPVFGNGGGRKCDHQ